MIHKDSSKTFASLPWRIRPMAQGLAAAAPLGHAAIRSASESTREGVPASRLLRPERNGRRPRPGRLLSVLLLIFATTALGGCFGGARCCACSGLEFFEGVYADQGKPNQNSPYLPAHPPQNRSG